MSERVERAVRSLSEFPVPGPEAGQYPVEYIAARRRLVAERRADTVVVAAAEESEPGSEDLAILRQFHRCPVRVVRVPAGEVAAYVGRLASLADGADGGSGSGPAAGNAAAGGDGAGAASGLQDELSLDALAREGPVVSFVNSVLFDAVGERASDVHLERFSREAVVRYRVDGVLRPVRRIPLHLFRGVSSRVKVMANLNIMEQRRPQDGRMSVELGGTPVDVRVSVVPIARGESIVLRLFPERAKRFRLDGLGLSARHVAALREVLSIPHGIFLVSGPTGSGKSTTLHAMLGELPTDRLKVVSIEDPVENVVDGIDQIQTDEAIGLTFAEVLRRVLRQDPDVIVVGEIRDQDTAELAVRAALTGHLVLASLHTNDAASAVTRLRDIGVPAYLIAAVLRGAMAQRLVRRVCPRCSEPRSPSAAEAKALEGVGANGHAATPRFLAGVGCAECGGTGYAGRMAVAELFRMEDEPARLVAAEAGAHRIAEFLAERGVESLTVAAVRAAAEGLTSVSEAVAVGAAGR